MPSNQDPVIDGERLRALLDGVNKFGRLETGGFDRHAFSDADMAARDWLAEQMETMGLAVRRDAAGNVIGRFGDGSGAAILIGSHLDTVPGGGALDGALGVCVALESVRALQAAGIRPASPIEVVATSDEEGRFGGMLGSEALAGKITRDRAFALRDGNGVMLADVLKARQVDPAALADAALSPEDVKAFLEIHIEQGPVLEEAGETIGIVETVTGICTWQVTLEGAANHAGTTPMDMRSDAFAGLAEIAATIPSIIRIVGGENSRVTVGKVEVLPNHPHTIPERVVFSLAIRDPKEKVIRTIAAAFRALIERIAKSRKLSAEIREAEWVGPAEMDADLAELVEGEATRLALPFRRMHSGAGHDAQVMQSLCPSALIFVPSRGGVSHAPAEATDWSDIESGASLFLSVLTRLCGAADDRDFDRTEEPRNDDLPAAAPVVAEEAEAMNASDWPSDEEETSIQPAASSVEAAEATADDDVDFDFDLDLDEISITDEDVSLSKEDLRK